MEINMTSYTSFIHSWPIIKTNGQPENVLETSIRLGNRKQDLQLVIDTAVDTGKIDAKERKIWKWGAVEFIYYLSPTKASCIIEYPAR